MKTMVQAYPTRQEELARLEAHLQSQLGNRVRHLRLVARDHGLVLQGQTTTYFAKLLAQEALLKATKIPLVANSIRVT